MRAVVQRVKKASVEVPEIIEIHCLQDMMMQAEIYSIRSLLSLMWLEVMQCDLTYCNHVGRWQGGLKHWTWAAMPHRHQRRGFTG